MKLRKLASADAMQMIRDRVARQKKGLVTSDYDATIRSLARFHRRLLSLERWYKKTGREHVNSKT